MPVLVTGATGNNGRAVPEAGLQRGLRLRAGVRDVSGALPEGIQRVSFDFLAHRTWDAALYSVRGDFLLTPPGLGARPLLPSIVCVRERRAGPLVYLSVQGAESSRVIPHRKVETTLMTGPRDWTILRPGFLAQNLDSPYRHDIREESRIYLPAGPARVAFLDVRDAGEVAAMALAEPGPHLGRGYTLTGAESLRFDEVARLLSEALGRRIRYQPASVPGYLRHLRQQGPPWGQALIHARLHLGLR